MPRDFVDPIGKLNENDNSAFIVCFYENVGILCKKVDSLNSWNKRYRFIYSIKIFSLRKKEDTKK